MLGAPAAIGRTFDASSRATAWSSAGVLPSRRARIRPASLGRPLNVADLNLPVLGILPPSASFPSDGTDLWIPAVDAPAVALKGLADDRRFQLVARVSPGATLEQVSEDTGRVRRELSSRPTGRGEEGSSPDHPGPLVRRRPFTPCHVFRRRGAGTRGRMPRTWRRCCSDGLRRGSARLRCASRSAPVAAGFSAASSPRVSSWRSRARPPASASRLAASG